MTFEQYQQLADAAEAAESLLKENHWTPEQRTRLQNALEAFRGKFGIPPPRPDGPPTTSD